MKIIISENQYNTIIDTFKEVSLQEQVSTLTVPEQTLLGFLNRFLRGEDGEFQNVPMEELKKTMLFNSKTIYPMAQKLLEKKKSGVKSYDQKTFNALFMAMNNAIGKDQVYEFYKDGGTITNITYSAQY